MQGRLKSFSVETSQGIRAIEVSSITGAGSHLPMLLDSHNQSARPQLDLRPYSCIPQNCNFN